jgi:hypothetical protein
VWFVPMGASSPRPANAHSDGMESKQALLGMRPSAYNENSQFQGGTVHRHLPHLRRAASLAPLPPPGATLCIAEFGCSHGGNSVAPVLELLRTVGARVVEAGQAGCVGHMGANHGTTPLEVTVYHEDLPTNAWEELFAATRRYVDEVRQGAVPGVARAVSCAVGCSFFERCLASATVSLGFSFTAVREGTLETAGATGGIVRGSPGAGGSGFAKSQRGAGGSGFAKSLNPKP